MINLQRFRRITLCILIACTSLQASKIDEQRFNSPDDSTAVHSWYHWISGNLTKEAITKDLESMQRQGIRQITILNVGGHVTTRVEGLDNVKFDSPEWWDLFRFTLDEARRLGIKVGAHNCDGWETSGGPWVPVEQSMKTFTWSKLTIDGGSRIKTKLPQPPANLNYYEDDRVLAYPVVQQPNSYLQATPRVTLNTKPTQEVLHDGNPYTKVSINEGHILDIEFTDTKIFEQVAFFPHMVWAWAKMPSLTSDFALYTSMNGDDYQLIDNYTITGVNKLSKIAIPKTQAKFARIVFGETERHYALSEVEFLSNDELPTYNPGLSDHIQKVIAVKAQSHDFDKTIASTRLPIAHDQVINISQHMSADGTLDWDAPKGQWQITRFGYTTTGAENGPATPEGVGLEIDKFDKSAAEHHFNSFPKKMLQQAGDHAGDTFKFFLIDSWECEFQNWTAAFPQEFEKRRGYSITPWIPVLCGELVDDIARSEAFMQDFRRTIAELLDENYYQTMKELCHENGVELHAEAIYYAGTYPPLDILKVNGYVDLPMYEFWARGNKDNILEYKPQTSPRFQYPSQSAAAYGQKVIGAESYTSHAHFSESPIDLKRWGDNSYVGGINQFILHSYVHQPIEHSPGMTLRKWGSFFNRNNPIWHKNQSWLEYHARVQHVMQNTEPVPQVATYLGDFFPQIEKKTSYFDIPRNIGANLCNLDVLQNRTEVLPNGQFTFGGQARYSLLTLPEGEDSLDYQSLETIARLVAQGITLYGPPPSAPIGLGDLQSNRKKFQKLVTKLWRAQSKTDTIDHRYGKGRVLWGISLEDALTQLKITPYIETNQDLKTLAFFHKQTGEDDVFFLSNQKKQEVSTNLTVKSSGKLPEIWHPESGRIQKLSTYTQDGDRLTIPMTFKPTEAYFLVLRPAGKTSESASPFTERESLDTIDLSKSTTSVRFQSTEGKSPAPIKLTQLQPLDTLEDFEVKHFGGTATYTFHFDNPSKNELPEGGEVQLNLGYFDAVATVSLNGILIGDFWNPYTPIILPKLKPTHNVLEVAITTTLRNRAIGDLKQFGKLSTLWSTTEIEVNLSKDHPLKPTGLMGPVHISLLGTEQ